MRRIPEHHFESGGLLDDITRTSNPDGSPILGTSTSSQPFPVANKAFYYPFTINFRPQRFNRLGISLGTPTAGNLDLGIYSSNGTRLVSTGSTVVGSALTTQIITISEILLLPGYYYFAHASDSGVGEYIRQAPPITFLSSHGLKEEASAFPLPATATMAEPTHTWIANYFLKWQ